MTEKFLLNLVVVLFSFAVPILIYIITQISLSVIGEDFKIIKKTTEKQKAIISMIITLILIVLTIVMTILF